MLADRNLAWLSSERLYPVLTETDAETQSQTLDRAGESYGRVGGRTEGLEGDRNSTGRQQSQLTWTLRGSQRLNHQPMSKLGLDLGPLNILSRCAAWSSCESSIN